MFISSFHTQKNWFHSHVGQDVIVLDGYNLFGGNSLAAVKARENSRIKLVYLRWCKISNALWQIYNSNDRTTASDQRNALVHY